MLDKKRMLIFVILPTKRFDYVNTIRLYEANAISVLTIVPRQSSEVNNGSNTMGLSSETVIPQLSQDHEKVQSCKFSFYKHFPVISRIMHRLVSPRVRTFPEVSVGTVLYLLKV